MNIKTIKYFCFYDKITTINNNRAISPAAVNKVDYITQAINSSSVFVELISLAVGNNYSSFINYLPKSNIQLSKYKTLQLFPSITSKFKLIRIIGKIVTRFFFISSIFFRCKRGESIIVYHSLGYANIVLWVKKIKKIRLILEVEEIYADVSGKSNNRKIEEKLFDAADAFIFSTELLEESINNNHKPYAVVYGAYSIEYKREFSFKDGLTHVVYAGTLDPRKGGPVAAASALFLDSTFHIHIIGFGTKVEEDEMKSFVATIREKTDCLVTFDGLLYGEDFISFIQACDIGLCPQNPDAAFNATSFPSKILTYLGNGLKVVSIRIPAIEKSNIGIFLNYYDTQTPQNIAEAISTASRKQPIDYRQLICKLDNDFKSSLLALLK